MATIACVDEVRFANRLRAARIRKGWRQEDLGSRAGLSRSVITRLESGRPDGVTIGTVKRLTRTLGLEMDVSLRWPGADLDRVMDAGHAGMHDAIARVLDRVGGWERAAEVSFSVFGERGVIDVLAFHPASRSILVVELKTLLVDVSDLLGTMDRRRRLARRVAAERGWGGDDVATWVVLAATSTNRRRVDAHRPTLRTAFPARGPEVRRWLEAPAGRLDGLSFLAYERQERTTSGRLRVRARSDARPRR